MSADSSTGHTNTSTATIYLIRHGEKPPKNPPPHGLTAAGKQDDDHSLTIRGWQRAGALMTLFAPVDQQFRAGFAYPDRLVAPKYTDAPAVDERTHQTIDVIRQQTGYTVEMPCKVAEKKDKLRAVGRTLGAYTGVTLVCWEHHDLQPIAQGIAPNADIPPWDDDRFDMVWVFTSDTGPDGFNFTQIPQLLLPGDISDPIVRKKKGEGAPQTSPA